MTTLRSRHSDHTKELILNSAIELMEGSSVIEMTARAIAKQAAISERTIFRYFPTRDDLLDAVALAVTKKMNIPAPPEVPSEILGYPKILFECFERQSALTKAALHSEIFSRIVETTAKQRWISIDRTLAQLAPQSPPHRRKIAAANIRYLLSATTWNYYRTIFNFTLKETVDAIQTSIDSSISALRTNGATGKNLKM